jgi:nitroimidazol reductase NimA-like FMN-containing flavoprotein (pyridoxamine 5'-phosphate oxidase superfamily)
MPSSLSPTSRSTPKRHAERAVDEREALYSVLDEAFICHLGVIVDGTPVVLPTAFGYDRSGPDPDGTLYLHGSVASRSLREGEGADICVTVSLLDGLVLARSGFHHSMNYRSAVIRGRARAVVSDAERRAALDLIVDHAVPGRSATLRAPSRKELAATSVLALSLHEAAVKVRTGGPVDDEADVIAGAWAGVVGLRTEIGRVEPDVFAASVGVPDDVQALNARIT